MPCVYRDTGVGILRKMCSFPRKQCNRKTWGSPACLPILRGLITMQLVSDRPPLSYEHALIIGQGRDEQGPLGSSWSDL